LTVSLCNTFLPLLEEAKGQFGGYIKRSGGVNKPCYTWGMSAKKGCTFLRIVLPYLVIKREQAEIALEFQSLRESAHRNGGLGEADLAARESARWRLHVLKGTKHAYHPAELGRA
jgi:hypothetical protein